MYKFFKCIFLILLCSITEWAFAYDFIDNGIQYTISSFTNLTVSATGLEDLSIRYLEIPKTVIFADRELKIISIGDRFAYNNKTIEEINSEADLDFIGIEAFYSCSGLKKVHISSCKKIGVNAFAYDMDLTKIELPNNLNTIDNEAFRYCNSIVEIELPKNINYLGSGVFKECTKLTKVDLSNLNITTISDHLFSYCNNLSEVYLPKSINSIKEYCFYNCENLKEIEIPNTTTSLENNALYGCKKLAHLYIPDSVTEMGYNCLRGCNSMKFLSIGAGINKLTEDFYGIEYLDTLEIRYSEDPITIVGNGSIRDQVDNKFYYYGAFAKKNIQNLLINRKLNYSFYLKKGFYQYFIDPPFSLNESLKTVIINEGGEFIEQYEHQRNTLDRYFYCCRNLKKVIYNSSAITEISVECFRGCSSLSEVNLNFITKIKDGAFAGCSSLKYLNLPSTTKHLSNSIVDCPLESLVLNSAIPPTSDSFPNKIYLNCKLIVPYGDKNIYSNRDPWKNFWNIEELPRIEAEQIVLNLESVELKIGETVQIDVTVLPEDATDKTITWNSSDSEIATVSDEGLMTAISAGEAIIRATCGEVSAECEITVLKDAGIESLLANPESTISVYTTDGILIKKDCEIKELKTLSKGIYIIKSGNKSYKIAL